jgi:hypothetical protein
VPGNWASAAQCPGIAEQFPGGLVGRRPLFGISVFAVLGMPLDDLLRQRFANFRAIYLPTVARFAGSLLWSAAAEATPECEYLLKP